MKHFIIVKFKDREDLERSFSDVKEIFERTLSIDGVEKVVLHKSNSTRSNRYDLMIEMTLSPQALPLYDACDAHKEWKEKYGDRLVAKAIFDCEEKDDE